jgi:class 3 adenylate cyclase/pimeloyl-ACP methyl ester carboxylesterase
VERPPIRYASSGDVQIAYQVTGAGPLDIVLAPGTVSHLDLWWESPVTRRDIEAFSAVARLVRFDKRGTGLSDRPTDAATLEERADDIRAVMDAVGLERAVVFGRSEGGQMACMFAATYPERTIALVTWGTMARWVQAEGHPWGQTPDEHAAMLVELEKNWPSEYYVRGPGAGLGQDADRELVAFVMRIIQAGASPAAVVALERMNGEVDIRDLLPTISVPALVMCNSHDPLAPAEGVRAIAEAIPGSRYVEFPGRTHFVGPNLDSMVATVQEFVTGQPAAAPTNRRLLTILFTDVVGSTERAVELGDARWRELLSEHYARTEGVLAAYGGREVDRAGDGILAVFEGPTRAIRCAQSIHTRARELGLELRAGIHTGEAEVVGDAVRGIAVHIAARVCGTAAGHDVLVSSTVRDLTAGAGLEYEDRGLHELKGVPEARRLFAVRS